MIANELRVGNWIEEEYNYFRKWSERDFIDYLKDNGHISDKIYPIPLTHETLDKAGFIDNELIINGNDNSRICESQDSTFSLWVQGYYSFGKCKYLHELQNLYFALTGEELNIQL